MSSNFILNTLPEFFQSGFIQEQLLEETPSRVNVIDEEQEVSSQLIELLPPENTGTEGVINFIQTRQENDLWTVNSLYSDSMFAILPVRFQKLLNEFDEILGGGHLRFDTRMIQNSRELDAIVENHTLVNKLDDLFNRVKGYYYDTNIFAMKYLARDLLDVIGHLIDKPVNL